MPSNYYSFKKRNIEFFVLDTNFDRYENDKKKINIQFKQISESIKKSKAKWKIVYGHHTWFSIGGHGGEELIVKKFLNKLLKVCSFDIYMCGHDHNKQIIELTNKKYTPIRSKRRSNKKKNIKKNKVTIIVCGTGGKVYDDEINYDYLNKNCKLQYFSNTLGFGYCNIYGNKFTLNFFDVNGNVEYTHILNK